jgi:hypothetical protein
MKKIGVILTGFMLCVFVVFARAEYFSSEVHNLVSDNGTAVGFDNVATNGLRVTNPRVPDNSTAACISGQISWDNAHLYWCYTDNHWRRANYDNAY